MSLLRFSPSDPRRWQKLAFALALMHVPGMKITDAAAIKGRRRAWDVGSAQKFVGLIDQINAKSGKGIREAIRKAIDRKLIPRRDEKTWVNRYYASRKLLRKANELKRRFERLGEVPR